MHASLRPHLPGSSRPTPPSHHPESRDQARGLSVREASRVRRHAFIDRGRGARRVGEGICLIRGGRWLVVSSGHDGLLQQPVDRVAMATETVAVSARSPNVRGVAPGRRRWGSARGRRRRRSDRAAAATSATPTRCLTPPRPRPSWWRRQRPPRGGAGHRPGWGTTGGGEHGPPSSAAAAANRRGSVPMVTARRHPSSSASTRPSAENWVPG